MCLGWGGVRLFLWNRVNLSVFCEINPDFIFYEGISLKRGKRTDAISEVMLLMKKINNVLRVGWWGEVICMDPISIFFFFLGGGGGGGVTHPPPLWIQRPSSFFVAFLLVREVDDVWWVPLLRVWKVDRQILRKEK